MAAMLLTGDNSSLLCPLPVHYCDRAVSSAYQHPK